ncbi:sigma-70 family RNA polymerase sigma factor [Gemmata sp.]|uniref:sigma-70 family RNA polymerase sigma factor n=1 Tax=Gemmata sp. TaxID=1914242 RepID=UPI003F730DC8
MDDDGSRRFVMLFARHERDLYRYVLTLLPSPADAEDVVQEAAAALWQNFGGFDPGRPFLPWACRFAYHQVLNFRRRQRTHRRLFSDAVVEALAVEWPADSEGADARREALDGCLGKLPPGDRDLVRLRYAAEDDVTALAGRTGQTANALYKSLQRIRKSLMDCVTRTLAEER